MTKKNNFGDFIHMPTNKEIDDKNVILQCPHCGKPYEEGRQKKTVLYTCFAGSAAK
jgi:hypothetical protein